MKKQVIDIMTAGMKSIYHKNIYIDFIKTQRNISSKSTYLSPVVLFSKNTCWKQV